MKHVKKIYGTSDPEALRYLREFQKGSNRIKRLFGVPTTRCEWSKKP